MSDIETPRFDRMMGYLQANADGKGDLELLALFTKYRKEISGLYEAYVPDGQKWMGWDPSRCTRAEMHGPYFHKAFRQMDVTATGKEDSRIWNLLSSWGDGPTSNTFWSAHHESMKDEAAV